MITGITAVSAAPLTGRVLIRFDERQVTAGAVLALARRGADVPPAAEQREWVVASVAPLGRRSPSALLAMSREQKRVQWAYPAGRRGLRRLGPRAFRTARSMQRRGERVLCLLRDGRPQGLFGVKEQRRAVSAPAVVPQPPAQAGSVLSLAGAAALGVSLMGLPLSLAALPVLLLCRRRPGRRTAAAEREAAAALAPDGGAPPPWHATTPTQTLDILGSTPNGLSEADARARLHRLGPNALRERPGPSAMGLFLGQFKEPMVLILLGAAGLSLALGERIDAIAIVGIVVVNAILAVAQEFKTRQALHSLQNMTAATARCLRDGQVTVVPADQLVIGDVVVLEGGDAVPADLRLIDGNNITAEEAALTGESGEVSKEPLALLDEQTPIGDRRNMAYMGTFFRNGRAKGVVVATGMATEMGRIAGMLQDADPGPTPLQRKMGDVNRLLVIAALAVSAAMVAVGILRGLPTGQVLVTAISTAVAAIPEGLPITVTIALALAVYRMGHRKAIVRHLPSVETLGSTMTICTDKTGTLTANQMAAREVWAGGTRYLVEGDGYSPHGRFLVDGHTVTVHHDSDLATALRMATLCTNAQVREKPDHTWEGDGDPTEVAILVAAARAGLVHAEVHGAHERLHEVPFDAAARSMTVVCRDEKGRVYAHVKGAPDKILKACGRWHLDGVDEYLTERDRAVIEAQVEAMAAGALRVLAVAYKPLPAHWAPSAEAHLEQDLIFAGLIGLMDPPRAEVRGALERCRSAGVRVLMVTGDHPHTALAVAKELGMAQEGDRALTGAEMERLSEQELAAALMETNVCARVAPDQKLRIVKALRSKGQVVAMTGDGVNDAPAIREADIGIAMGRGGTEVTRATADMVLMDDNFATIVGAIEEGRGTYDNIRRTVRYTIATNVAEVALMFGAVLAGVPLPLLPVHLLWVNLACDGVPALSLAFDRPARGCMDRPPHRAEDGLFAGGLWRRTTARGIALGLGTLALFGGVLAATGNLVLARSAAMATLITSKLTYLLEVRRDESGRHGLQPNPVLAGAIVLSSLLFLATLYVPALQPIFKSTGLGVGEWLGVAGVTLAAVLLERLTIARWGRDGAAPAPGLSPAA